MGKRKIGISKVVAIAISCLMASQPAFVNAAQISGYTTLSESDVLPLISNNQVKKLGNVEANKQISITIGLKFRNKAQLAQKIKTSNVKGNTNPSLSANELSNNFLPSKSSNDTIVAFLKENGLTVTKTYNSHMTIEATGSVQQIEAAFKINLYYYSKDGETFFANDSEPELPSNMAQLIESIDGLNNLQIKNSAIQYKKQASVKALATSAYTPSQIQKAYNLSTAYTNNLNGSGVKIAVATYDSFNEDDVNSFLNNFGITRANEITVKDVDGAPQYDANGSLESTMDVECSLSSAPGAQLLVYDGATPDTKTELDMFNEIINDGQANVVTYSWGASEAEYTQSQLSEMDNLFMAGAAKGITFLVASGDNGSSEINYPATDPYVTAVGGTTLSTNGNSGAISSETAWSLDSKGYGSGGGESSYFSLPSWQSGLNGASNGHRMIPDVSLDANPNTGYLVYFNGEWMECGGTSAAAPEWAAIMALADESRQNNGLGNLGAANASLYALSGKAVFNDITSGNNGSYACSTGYDMVTGLGSVDAWKLINNLSNVQQYTITYNGNGNTSGTVPVDSSKHTSGTAVTVLGNTGNLSKSGYTFAGWNTSSDGGGTNYSASSTFTMGSDNVTLYAKWNKNYAPIGYIDTPASEQTLSGIQNISGWALDGSTVSKVEVLVDNNVVGTANYGDTRSDVEKAYPAYNNLNSGYHYSLDTTKLTNAKHTISIRETANDGTQTVLAQEEIKVSNATIEYLDTPGANATLSGVATVSGWFLDKSGVAKIEVLINGSVVGTATYGDARDDVEKAYPAYNNVNSGYHYSLDTTSLKDGTYSISIRETGGNGQQATYAARSIRVLNSPIGYIDAPASEQTISGIQNVNGWVLDGSTVSKVEVLVDNNVVGTASYGDARSDVEKVYSSYNNANSGYHYSLDTTKLTNSEHLMSIRETSKNGTQTTVATDKIKVLNIPIGYIDTPTTNETMSGIKEVSGWFLDKSGVAKVEVLVNGSVVGTAVYGDARGDVEKVYPTYNNENSGYHYNFDTTKLKDGTYSLAVRETGGNGQQTTYTLNSIKVLNAPMGYIDTPASKQTISGSQNISGWVLDGSTVSKIEVLVDNNVVGTASYGDVRSDVEKAYPAYNNSNSGYHYSLDTTKLTNTTHTIAIRETGINGVQTTVASENLTVSNTPIGYLDTPTGNGTLSGVETVSGWFLDRAGVSKIEVMIDGNSVGTASYGDVRSDVEKAYPSYNTVNSGYHYSLDTTKLTNGTHTIAIKETGNNGVSTAVASHTVKITN